MPSMYLNPIFERIQVCVKGDRERCSKDTKRLIKKTKVEGFFSQKVNYRKVFFLLTNDLIILFKFKFQLMQFKNPLWIFELFFFIERRKDKFFQYSIKKFYKNVSSHISRYALSKIWLNAMYAKKQPFTDVPQKLLSKFFLQNTQKHLFGTLLVKTLQACYQRQIDDIFKVIYQKDVFR